MRYPDGGGLTAAGRARRESVRLQAAWMYEQDVSAVRVAHRLRVSTKSAYQWRRCWRAGDRGVHLLRGRGRAEPSPAQGRTWAPRGHTPTVRVSGKGSGRVSVEWLISVRCQQLPHPLLASSMDDQFQPRAARANRL